MAKVNWSGLLTSAQRCKRQVHHTLKVGDKVEMAGLKGRIVGYCADRVISTQPALAGEWYYVEIYSDESHIPWKCARQYLTVR